MARLGVRQVQACGLQCGLRSAQVGIGLAVGILAFVVLALSDGAFLQQAGGAVQLTACVWHAGLRSSHLGFGAVHVGSVGRGVHSHQQVALLDEGAFLEVHSLQGACNTGAHLYALHGLQAARKLVPQRYVFLQHGCHRHGYALRGGPCRGRFSVRVLQAQGRAPGSHGRCQRRLR